MIKELGTYTINGQDAVFQASVVKKLFKTMPQATFSFSDGSSVSCTYDVLSGTYTYSGEISPEIVYSNGAWDFK